MAKKRLTDIDKWDDPWFSSLPSDSKLAWLYILDKCNHAGIYKVNKSLMNFQIGVLPGINLFDGRVIELNSEKWFIPKFIGFQYGFLEESNRVHKSVINELKKLGVFKDYLKSFEGLKDKDKDIDKDIDKEKEKNTNFDQFWTAYPKKVGKGAAEKAWKKAFSGIMGFEIVSVLESVNHQKKSDQWQKDGGQFIPNPATWLNQKRWLDEVQDGRPKPDPDLAKKMAQKEKEIKERAERMYAKMKNQKTKTS